MKSLKPLTKYETVAPKSGHRYCKEYSSVGNLVAGYFFHSWVYRKMQGQYAILRLGFPVQDWQSASVYYAPPNADQAHIGRIASANVRLKKHDYWGAKTLPEEEIKAIIDPIKKVARSHGFEATIEVMNAGKFDTSVEIYVKYGPFLNLGW